MIGIKRQIYRLLLEIVSMIGEKLRLKGLLVKRWEWDEEEKVIG